MDRDFQKTTVFQTAKGTMMSQSTQNLYAELIGVLNKGQRAAILSVYAPDGAITKRVVTIDGNTGNEDEAFTLSAPEAALTDGPVTHLKATDGTLTVTERYLPKPRLIILGGGHIALALTKMAKACEFYTLVFDDRPMFANAARFPDADEVICDNFSRLFERIKIRSTDYVVIVTRGHKHDQECLEGVLKGDPPAYTGMIGSRRRVAIVMKQLADAGYPRERLNAIYSPIGLRIGAVTPAEISVSILSELIRVKRVDHEDKNNVSCDLEIVAQLAEHGETADALITILETHGSVPRETGAKMGMTYEGAIIGTIGGGCAESELIQDARTLIREGGWRITTVDMTDTAEEDGMVCGGNMTVLLEHS
jgi:xanthine dehydrogenase accessory factor